MKKTILISAFVMTCFASCDTANQILTTVGTVYANGGLTNDDIVAGLKQALTIGTQNGTTRLSTVRWLF